MQLVSLLFTILSVCGEATFAPGTRPRKGVSMALRGTDVAVGAVNQGKQLVILHKEVEVSVNAELEATLDSMVKTMLNGGGPSMSEVLKASAEKMSPQDALKRLGNKLPTNISVLAHHATRKHGQDPDTERFTEDNLANARSILNGMIEQSWDEMDEKVLECKEFEERNRETTNQVRTDMARLGEDIADLERLRTEANQGVSSKSEAIQTIEELIAKEKGSYDAKLRDDTYKTTLYRNDLAVVRFIMEFTECPDVTSFIQRANTTSMIVAPQVCSIHDKDFDLRWHDHKLQAKYETLMTPESRHLFRKTLARLFGGRRSVGFLGKSVDDDDGDDDDDHDDSDVSLLARQQPEISDSSLDKFRQQKGLDTNKPTMTHEVTPVHDGPTSGQWKKCVDTAPNCGLLHDSMSLMWGKFKDKIDQLQVEMDKRDQRHKEVLAQANEQLKMLGNAKGVFNKMLSEAISNMNEATSMSDQKLSQSRSLEKAFRAKMNECQSSVKDILFNDVCAVRKIRNSIMTYSTVSPPDAIEDCDVSEFVPGACSASCDNACPSADPNKCGGIQTLAREILTGPNKFGVSCPGLQLERKCNQIRCPVDCEVSSWSGWGKCTKECGGGVQGKTRSVLTKPRNGGRSCDTVQEERACHTGSCDRSCKLKEWTLWDSCSMACGGGVQTRKKGVLVPTRGHGKCPKPVSPHRKQERVCNPQECIGDEYCIAKQDLIIAIDSSGSLMEEGANAVRDFAEVLVSRMAGRYFGDYAMKVGVIQYGNGAVQDDGTVRSAINVHALSHKLAGVKRAIRGLKWQKGFTNMAQALALADTMLQRGGRASAQSAVLIIGDTHPSFVFQTKQQVDQLKAMNVKLLFAPISKFRSKSYKEIQRWASAPWQTHLVRLPGLSNLKADPLIFAQKCIATFCPKAISPSALETKEHDEGFMLVRMNGRCGEHGPQLGQHVGSAAACKALAQKAGFQMFSYGKAGLRVGHCVGERFKQEVEPMQRVPGAKYCRPYNEHWPYPGPKDAEECAEACKHETANGCVASTFFPNWYANCYLFRSCSRIGNSQYQGKIYMNPTMQKTMAMVKRWRKQRVSPKCPLDENKRWTDDQFYDFYALSSLVDS